MNHRFKTGTKIFLKFVITSIVYSILFGIVNDLITAQMCPEYFNDFRVFYVHAMVTKECIPNYANNPIVLALFWGFISTWWVGAILGSIVGILAIILEFVYKKKFALSTYIKAIVTLALSVLFIVYLVSIFRYRSTAVNCFYSRNLGKYLKKNARRFEFYRVLDVVEIIHILGYLLHICGFIVVILFMILKSFREPVNK